MRELLLVDFENLKYGVWKDEVLSVKEGLSLHRIPLSPTCIAGMSILDGRAVTLADLSVCLGLPPLTREGPGRVLVLSEQEKLTGFVVEGEITPVAVPPDAVLPMPDYLKTPAIDACVLHQSALVPVINITALYNHVQRADPEPPVPDFIVNAPKRQDILSAESIRVFESGGGLFAASAEGTEEPVRPGAKTKLALVPQYVHGITYYRGNVVPLIHLSQRMKLAHKGSGDVMLVARIGAGPFGFLVDSDEGMVSGRDVTIRPMPPIAQSSWMQAAALLKGDILPLVDLAALASVRLAGAEENPVFERYTADSRFPALFSFQDVEVVEFLLLGARHAVPKSEVEATLPFKPYRHVPNVQPIVIGLAEHDGELLPVLDLAMCFGRRSLATPEWRMILVRNGDFRALVITEATFGERLLTLAEQKGVPIKVPHNVVYGCYPDPAAVRLILNVEALAVHFDRSLVKDLLPALSREMGEASAEIVPALLGPQESTALRGPDVSHEPEERMETAAPIADREPVWFADNLEPLESAAGTEEPRDSFESKRQSEEEIPVAETQASESFVTAHSGQEELPRPEVHTEPVSSPIDLVAAEPRAESSPESEIQSGPGPEPVTAEQPVQPVSHECIESPPAAVEGAVPEKEAASMNQEPEHAANSSEESMPVPELAEKGKAEGEEIAAASIDQGAREEAPSTVALEEEHIPPETFRQEESTVVTDAPGKQAPSSESSPASRPEPISLHEETVPASVAGAALHDAVLARKDERATNVPTLPVADRERLIHQEESTRPGAVFAETSAAGTWKRRLACGAAVAVLVGILYASGVFEQSAPVKTAAIEDLPSEKTSPENTMPRPSIAPPDPAVYQVKQGDTLWSISRRFTGSPYNYPRVARDNGIEDPDLIFPGQKVQIRK